MTTSSKPSTRDEQWGGRLPLARTGPLDKDQRALRDELLSEIEPWARRSGFSAATEEGDLIGPFNAFVHRPGAGKMYLDWVRAEQNRSVLAAPLREIIILTIGVA